jgi:hypothetical protein
VTEYCDVVPESALSQMGKVVEEGQGHTWWRKGGIYTQVFVCCDLRTEIFESARSDHLMNYNGQNVQRSIIEDNR